MGMNVYLEAVDQKGFLSQSAGTSVRHNISGKSNKRIAISAFQASCGTVATHLYFMQTLGTTTAGAAAASGVASMTLTADPGPSGNGIAANDNVVTVLDNGTYQFRICKSWVAGTKAILFHDNHADTIAAGNAVYDLGVNSDTGHVRYKMTASTGITKELELGIVFGAGKGYPMIAYLKNAAANLGLDDINLISIGYINK